MDFHMYPEHLQLKMCWDVIQTAVMDLNNEINKIIFIFANKEKKIINLSSIKNVKEKPQLHFP